MTGHLRVTAAARVLAQRRRSYIQRQSFSAPYHLSKPDDYNDTLWLQVAQVSGGILANDRLDFSVEVQAGARLSVITPAATRVLTMSAGEAVVKQRLKVAAGGWLEVWPDSLVPHAGSRLRQRTEIEVARGGSLRFLEVLSPGRVAHGESLAWDFLELGLQVRYEKRPLLQECLRLTAETWRRWTQRSQMATPWSATLLLIRPEVWTVADQIRLNAFTPGTMQAGFTLLSPESMILRVLAPNGIALRGYLKELRQAV